MKIHDTPIEVAKALCSYAPAKIDRLLEPSAGRGALLEGMFSQEIEVKNLVCIDVNNSALSVVENTLKNMSVDLDLYNSDFLELGSNKLGFFDCVLMNPPFAGKFKSWKRVDYTQIDCLESNRYSPIEGLFVLKSINLLKENGTLLAVLPATIISSFKAKWLRELIAKQGQIICVHELPKKTFKNVECRVYLFVFKKSQRRNASETLLLNHDLETPVKMKVDFTNPINDLRFDYSFHYGINNFLNIMQERSALSWVKLASIATVSRGKISAPLIQEVAIHTTEYKNCFWNSIKTKDCFITQDIPLVCPLDVLVKRVGRDCCKSFGVLESEETFPISDCVFTIRAHAVSRNELLFILRVVYCGILGERILHRGTGATYIAGVDLKNILLPIDLPKISIREFEKYVLSLENKDYESMIEIENDVRKKWGFNTK